MGKKKTKKSTQPKAAPEVQADISTSASQFSIPNSHFLIPKLRFPEFRDAPAWNNVSVGDVLGRVDIPIVMNRGICYEFGVRFLLKEERNDAATRNLGLTVGTDSTRSAG